MYHGVTKVAKRCQRPIKDACGRGASHAGWAAHAPERCRLPVGQSAESSIRARPGRSSRPARDRDFLPPARPGPPQWTAGLPRLSAVRLRPAASKRGCKAIFYKRCCVKFGTRASSLFSSPKHNAAVDFGRRSPPPHVCFPNYAPEPRFRCSGSLRRRPQRALPAQARSAQPNRHFAIPPLLADGSGPLPEIDPSLPARHGLAGIGR